MMRLSATFTVDLLPGEDLPAADGRYDLSKTWTGDLEGTSSGLMLTSGDPVTGSAGYIALERFEGVLDGRRGTVTFHQLGTMADGQPTLEYVIAPGSGSGELTGLQGTLSIERIDDDGIHHVSLDLV
ncbi:hypothetical protein CFK39_01615 [Brachybacterium avium]|uniref:DUF3224 domain-containing protein n=1 Tax=Brachybacterium avium TaxID=2017485 RepID=A0A220UAI8_9MICO|nr:DUF3224 domain-containing protein [Brachybacterium avium]ASK64753.1 hypothetical protein CFK39_01615 [Brachybacterium avium]